MLADVDLAKIGSCEGENTSAEMLIFFEERDPAAGPGQGQGRTNAGEAAADHRDILHLLRLLDLKKLGHQGY